MTYVLAVALLALWAFIGSLGFQLDRASSQQEPRTVKARESRSPVEGVRA